MFIHNPIWWLKGEQSLDREKLGFLKGKTCLVISLQHYH